MKFRVPPTWPIFPMHRRFSHHLRPSQLLRRITNASRRLDTSRFSLSGGGNTGGGGGSGSSSSKGDSFLVPGATVATLLMLAILHARRMYDDRKVEDFKERGIDLEFSPDMKATFLKLIPLRSISRCWGYLTSMEIPVSLRPVVYKAWARAFHSSLPFDRLGFPRFYVFLVMVIISFGFAGGTCQGILQKKHLEEVALPLEKYASLQEFFSRSLIKGSRKIDFDPHCLVSPVDGTVLRFGELQGPGALIEQVKGFSYSASALLGANTFLPEVVEECNEDFVHEKSTKSKANRKSRTWWKVSFASPKLQDSVSGSQAKGVFYCVIYLWPGDYHHVHSPADWHVYLRRHFSGHLLPVNERATRTVKNLYTENERVVLEGQWKEGFMAIAAVGATNVGSIKLFIEPELTTNKPKELVLSEPPDERVYDPVGSGITIKKGEEIATFNMGSTVVLVFQAPLLKPPEDGRGSSDFRFCVQAGDRVRVGEAIGRWDC